MTTDGDTDSGDEPAEGRVVPQSVPEADAFRFDRVDRSGGGAADPPVRQGTTLVVDERGITSSGPRRRRKTLLPWSEVTRVSIGDDTPGPGGRTEVPIEVESLTGRFRYVVRSDRPLSVAMAALEVQVDRWGAPVERPLVPDAPAALGPPLPPPQPVPSLPVPPELLEAPSEVSDEPDEVIDVPAGVTGVEVTDAETDAETDADADAETETETETEAVTEAETETPTVADEPDQVSDEVVDAPANGLEVTERAPIPHAAPVGTLAPYAVAPAPGPAARPRRTRRTVTLVVALSLLISGIGLGIGLALSSPSTSSSSSSSNRTRSPAPPSADQRLADRLMLTRSDLPTGWRVAEGGGATVNSPAVQRGETAITRTLAHCMGISESEASIVLGGRAADQTAQASSPIFVAPTPSASAGSALELQSAATIVRTHGDERADFALLSNPRYPRCAATAAAAELQLGVDQTAKGSNQPGPATVSPVTLPGPGGVQTNALLMAFSVRAGAASVSVQVESIWLGSQRVEANLQIFAIGGQIPAATVLGPISTFQDRVASGGKDSTV